uniref:Major capsid protein n=1 Tax=Siphoviridae sp. ctvv53 TaxID=2826513 RepID=A0A8S5QLB3_9CAUD|nr:MAG TPA: major capsid protein [Siphoviridae sp. ctvv53]
MRKHFDIAVFADQADDAPVETFDLEIPENLSDLSAADLGDLRSKAVDAFQTLYAGGEFTDEDLATLGTLTDGIEVLSAEISAREQAAAERAAKAAEMAAKVGADQSAKPAPADDDEDQDDAPSDAADGADDAPAEKKADAAEDEAERQAAEQAQKKAKAAAADVEPEAQVDAEPEAVTAAAAPRGPIKLSGIRRHVHTPAPAITEETSVEDTRKARMTVADVPGFAADSDATFEDLAVALDRRLQGFNSGAYAAAARAGRAMSERHSLAVVRKTFDERATVSSPESADAAMAFAVNEKNLPGGSLVAAGGWCAPSETVYDLLEDESRDGLISLPEINVTRGGIKFTKGPKFADLYAAPSFNFTEEEAKAGKYAPTSATDPTNKVGAKPVYSVPCTDFEEVRLSAAGIHVQANLLQQRGYPELVARTIRGALVAHEHKMSERIIASMERQSTAVPMDSGQIGAAAPILTAIELQVEHYRYAQRLSRSTTLEAVFPYWVHGAIRTDLSRREGVDLIDVNDARIDAWFKARGVNPQFVYDWQGLTGDASAFKVWPGSLKFLLYSAGTFVKGGQDVITLDTVYDSVLLGQNDYTALFTEEGYLVAKRGHDARVVTVPLNPNGGTGTGIKLLANGTADPAK